MNRSGVTVDEARALAKKGFSPHLVMSHLGSAADAADPRNARQLERFREVRALFPNARASLAASSGIYLGEAYRFDMVRPGISLFGGGPKEVPDDRFKAVATLTAPVLQVRDVAAGEQAGYGSTFTAPRDMRIAVVACGYADGFLRRAQGRASAVLNGKPAPLAYVTMDLIGLDVTEILSAQAGDEAELLGSRANLDVLANAIGTAAHECLVRLGVRGERVYRSAV
jgi:alanine racemase